VTHGLLEKLIIGLYLGEGGAGTLIDSDIPGSLSDPAGYAHLGGESRKQEGVSRTQLFAELLTNGGGDVEVAEDIQPKRYQKNICEYRSLHLARRPS
jgi:2-dehydropantoate 2-reductase